MRKTGIRPATRAKYKAAIQGIIDNPGHFTRGQFITHFKVSANLTTVLVRSGMVNVVKSLMYWAPATFNEADLDTVVDLMEEYEVQYKKRPDALRVRDTVQDASQLDIDAQEEENEPSELPKARSFTLLGYTITITRAQ